MPDEQLYGSWDADHSRLLVFPQTKWTDIVQNPIPYLNSQWEVHSDVATEDRKYKRWGAVTPPSFGYSPILSDKTNYVTFIKYLNFRGLFYSSWDL
jgi:hypothetical protein